MHAKKGLTSATPFARHASRIKEIMCDEGNRNEWATTYSCAAMTTFQF